MGLYLYRPIKKKNRIKKIVRPIVPFLPPTDDDDNGGGGDHDNDDDDAV